MRTRCCLAGRDFNRAADDDRQGQSHVWECFNSAGSTLASGLLGGVGLFPLARGLRPGAGSQRQQILSSRLGAVDIDIISPLLSFSRLRDTTQKRAFKMFDAGRTGRTLLLVPKGTLTASGASLCGSFTGIVDTKPNKSIKSLHSIDNSVSLVTVVTHLFASNWRSIRQNCTQSFSFTSACQRANVSERTKSLNPEHLPRAWIFAHQASGRNWVREFDALRGDCGFFKSRS